MKKIQELKAVLKLKTAEIVECKALLRGAQKSGSYAASRLMSKLHYRSLIYRNHHIAYCELRGWSRDQIEKPKKDNLPDEGAIAQLKLLYTEVE